MFISLYPFLVTGYDVPVLSQYLDWIAVMTYDYHGQWDKKTGHVAPMYAHSQDDNLAFNTVSLHHHLSFSSQFVVSGCVYISKDIFLNLAKPCYIMVFCCDFLSNQNFTIHYWLQNGADRKKLVMGLPMYGQSFTLSMASDNGLNQKTYGGGEAGTYTRARGFLAYYEVRPSRGMDETMYFMYSSGENM